MCFLDSGSSLKPSSEHSIQVKDGKVMDLSRSVPQFPFQAELRQALIDQLPCVSRLQRCVTFID